MSKDETDIAVLLDNAENMIAEGLDNLAHAQKCVMGLRKQLFDCEAKLAECKKELAEKPKVDGPTPELLREFVEAVAKGKVAEFGRKRAGVSYSAFVGKMHEYYGEVANAVLEPHPKGFDAWEAKYYPVSAAMVPEEQRARAALMKWRGLTPEVLAEYGLARDGVRLSDGKRRHDVESGTCPLCRGSSCRTCLLDEALGGHSCAGGSSSPHFVWCETGDAGPMIAALEKAVELEKERSGEVMKAG